MDPRQPGQGGTTKQLWRERVEKRKRGKEEQCNTSECRANNNKEWTTMNIPKNKLFFFLTMTPPPSLSLALAISRHKPAALSVHPKINVCSLSMTVLRPFFKSSIFSMTASMTKPVNTEKMTTPNQEIKAPITRCPVDSISMWGPGSIKHVYVSHNDSSNPFSSNCNESL